MILPDKPVPRTSALGQCASKTARKGKAVFPCEVKKPLTRNGLKDATTDQRRINMWWKRWPEANIAAPTGLVNGFWTVDVDNFTSLEILEAEHGELPKTLTAKTGGGGMHLFFKYPAGETIRNSAGKLGPGLDVRGEGGYVILPPSRTEGAYEWLEKLPIAKAPEWLVELVREKPKESGNRCRFANDRPKTNLAGGDPIPEGERNVTLTSIAGYLHDGSRDLPELTEDLLQINATRCEPPLEAEEVEGIAKSIHRLAPCKKGPRFDPPTPEVIGILGDILRDWWNTEWPGVGGKSDRDVLLTYILFALESGTILPNGGILVDNSHHQAAERARKSSSTAYNAFRRLSAKGWCRSGGNGPDRREDRPSGIVLLPRPAKERKPEHPLPASTGMGGVFGFASLPTARRGRHSAPGLSRIASASRIAAVDHLERFDGFASERALGDAMGLSRVYDLRTRYLEPLEGRGVVERIEHRTGRRVAYSWRLTRDWQVALEHIFAEEEELERELYSDLTSDERQRKRREESRERWLNRDSGRSDYHYANLGAHGYVEDLRPAEEETPEPMLSELARAIREYLDANPHDAHQPPGWIGKTLWAFDLYTGKPTSAEAQAAVDELGGEAYLRHTLERAKEAA